jgi:D-alanyl-D-alanine carboxypeptidase
VQSCQIAQLCIFTFAETVGFGRIIIIFGGVFMNNNDGLRRSTNRRRSVAANKTRKRKTLIIVLVVALVLIWTALILLLVQNNGKKNPPSTDSDASSSQSASTTEQNTPAISTAPAVTTNPETSEPESTVPAMAEGFVEIKATEEDLHEGDLILINYTLGFEFVQPEGLEDDLKMLYGSHPSSHYTHVSVEQYLRSDVLDAFNELMADFYDYSGDGSTQSKLAYRSYDDQKKRFDQYGEKYYAYPGYSEHQTGTAIDLNVFRRVEVEGSDETKIEIYELGYFDIFDWIYENCHKYGFILRYPENKVSKTGVDNDKDHFRYVGKAHATYMYENGLCLEEYLAELQSHTYEDEHIIVEAESGRYEIYYVPAAVDENDNITETSVPVPEKLPYTISGNNYDGFIVTVELG